MSNYLALYRKWRPKNFDDLVGQEHVARTLSNAISGHKLAHAYLFTGPRGTGKTSTARIFAKSLNCVEGPTVRPCEQCPACEGISRGNFPDVIEIDAASNRGVDDARDLRDRVRFAPTHGRYKVFIIDEVHMLTNEAFNALLKTIEEPPPNLVFILATTDVHKVLPTIISRCQRFDFQRIPFPDLVARLRYVTEQEGFTVDPAGLEAIAKRADGGLRDGLSLLDQVRACASTETISADDVFNALGIVSNDAVVAIVRAIAESQVVPAIEGLQSLLAAGFDHHAVVRELLEFFRHLMLVGVAGDRAQALEIPAAQLPPLQELATRLATPEVLYAMEVLRETEGLLKGSNQMTVWLELAIMRLCQREEIPSITDLMRRVAALEEKVASIGSQPAPRQARPTYAAPPPSSNTSLTPSAPSEPPAASAATTPVASVGHQGSVPTGGGEADPADLVGSLAAALKQVHFPTQGLVQQHCVFARQEGDKLVLGVKALLSLFEQRKNHIAKAATMVVGSTVAVSFVEIKGDTARPKLAGVASAPASPTPLAAPTPAPAPVAAAPVPPPPVAAPPVQAPPVAAHAPATSPSPPAPPAAPAPAGEPTASARELVDRAADIFNGRVIEPAL